MSKKIKWEVFIDYSYYHLWAVRPVGDKSFNSQRIFHFVEKSDAEKLKELLEKAY
jgi:hypothetical protein